MRQAVVVSLMLVSEQIECYSRGMMDYERPPANRQEYAELDEDTIHAYCFRLDSMLERVPSEGYSCADITQLKHESIYDGLVESGRGDIVPVEHGVQIQASYYSKGPIQSQYEVAIGTMTKRTQLPAGFIDNELYVRPRLVDGAAAIHQFEKHIEGYIFLVHRDGSMSAYVESVDLSQPAPAVTTRAMVLYDAMQLNSELDRVDALQKAATSHGNRLSDTYDYGY